MEVSEIKHEITCISFIDLGRVVQKQVIINTGLNVN